MAEQYKSLHPAKYYRDHLAHDIRPDGREFLDFRPVIINVNSIATADGSAIAKVGNSVVICGVKAELCKPRTDLPKQGFLVPNLELPPLCSGKFKSGPPSEQAQVLTQLIADIIENSKCINLEDLCICPDKLAWCLYADLICLDFDGAVVDASIIALMACLKSVQLPSIHYDSALNKIQVDLEDKKLLNISSTPVATTFAVFDDKIILSDPTVDEESLCSGILTVVVSNDELCCVHKPGGSPLAEEELGKCVETAKTRAASVKELLKTALLEKSH